MAKYQHSLDARRPIITVNQGMVCGIEEKLPNGGSFYSFKGIPYAKPPIGELRFEVSVSFNVCLLGLLIFGDSLSQPPRPLEIFEEEILDCSKERDVCFHRDLITFQKIGSEDCLHLNVHTPAKSGTNVKLPVMIWIHGGAFVLGSGSSD